MIQPTSPLAQLAVALGLMLSLAGSSGCSAGDAPTTTEGAATSVVAPGEPGSKAGEMSAGGWDATLAPVDPRAEQGAAASESTPGQATSDPSTSSPQNTMSDDQTEAAPTEEVATLGAGCFWCIEAVLEQVEGVKSVESGYTGGETDNPTYKDICTGRTGHAEVVRVTFDPSVLTYAELLDWFWRLHDPTTLNRQGNDRGTQYRSAIFVHSDEQRKIAETSKRDVQPTFDDPIVTEVTGAAVFYPAEQNHQGYYFDNTSQGYCQMVIAPKLKKLGLKY